MTTPRDVLADEVFDSAEEPYTWADRVISKLYNAGFDIIKREDLEREAFCAVHCGPPFTPEGEHAIDCPLHEPDDEATGTTIHVSGGPWAQQTHETERVVGPVFAVGDEVGNHYWLDTKSDPPTYVWDGTEWQR